MRNSSQEQLRAMVADLLKVEAGLTDGQVDFIDDMNRWRGDYRGRQPLRIEQIWTRVLGDKVTTN